MALMVMNILLAVALGISAIFVGQLQITREMGDSVIAFYAADTGIERVLYSGRETPSFSCPAGPPPCSLDNGAEYYVIITPGGDCTNFCIRSVGTYNNVRRAIEVSY